MSEIDWFSFENKDLDFPIYRKNPHVPKWGWIVLFIVMFIGLILSVSNRIPISILSCLVILIPVLYFLKWDYKAIFQKPSLRDVGMAVALFAGYIIYAMVMSTVLEYFGIMGGELVESGSVTLMSLVPLIFSLMSEELVKFIPLMFFMRVIFKYSGNRKMAIIMAVLLVMVFFASIHAYTFNMFLFALAIQGFGSIFELFGYIKTKNILVSYITHLCTDMFIYLVVFLGL